MRKYLAMIVVAVLFMADLWFLFSSGAISTFFEPDLALSALQSENVRLGLAQEIAALAGLPEDLEKAVSEALYRVLSTSDASTVRPVLKTILPALKSYLLSSRRPQGELFLNITPIKEPLIEDLEKSSPKVAEEIKTTIPDRVDVSEYMYIVLPESTIQAFRIAGTMPRIAGAVVVLMTVACLFLHRFSARGLKTAGGALGLSSVTAAVSACILPRTAKTAALSWVLAGIEVPGDIRRTVLDAGMGLLAGNIGKAALLLLIPAGGLCLAGLFNLPEKLAARRRTRLASIAPGKTPGARRIRESSQPASGVVAGWMLKLAQRFREDAVGFEQLRLTPEYRALNRKRAIVSVVGHVLVYALLLAAIPLFFRPGLRVPFPPYGEDQMEKLAHVYNGKLSFSGDNAFNYLATFIRDNPQRQVNTPGGDGSAVWIQKEFACMGLKTRLEKFTFVLKPPQSMLQDRSLLGTTVADLTVPYEGTNVIAESPGKIGDVILIGAHRDTAGKYPGAEDNASGTASMLELARVLSSGEHLYTYVFVSFDGEEAGLKGSEAFVSMNREMPVRLAIVLDMTGYKGANTVGFYPTDTGRAQAPLWTVVLANHVLKSGFNLSPFYWDANPVETDSSVVLYWQARLKKTSGRIPTDSEPFVNAGIPAIGIMAARAGTSPNSLAGRVIHGDEDVLDQVSSRTLELTGRFVEEYVRTLESTAEKAAQAGFADRMDPSAFFGKGELGSGFYLITPGSILPPGVLRGLTVYCVVLALFLVALTFVSAPGNFRHLAGFAAMELPWLPTVAVLAWTSAALPGFLSSPSALPVPFFLVHSLWFVVSLGGTLLLTSLRARFLRQTGLPYSWVTIRQKQLLNLIYCALLLCLLPASNTFIAFEIILLPLFFFGRINYDSEAGRAIWLVGLGFWLFSKFIGSGNWLKGFLYNAPVMPSTTVLFLSTLSWMLTLLYVASTPPSRQSVVSFS